MLSEWNNQRIEEQQRILEAANDAMRRGSGPDVDRAIQAAMTAEQMNYPSALLALKEALAELERLRARESN